MLPLLSAALSAGGCVHCATVSGPCVDRASVRTPATCWGRNPLLGDLNSHGRDSDPMSAVQDQATVAEDTRRGKDRSTFYKEAAKCPSPVEGKKILEEVEAGR